MLIQTLARIPRRAAVVAAAAVLCGAAHATITLNLTGGVLQITADGADFIVVNAADAASAVNVSGQTIGTAGQVTNIVIVGGSGDNQITLQAVSQSNFPQLTSVTINGGGGNDDIFGSQISDTIIDPDGGDDIQGETGDNEYVVSVTGTATTTTILAGLGALTINGGSGDDTFTLAATSVTIGAQVVNFAQSSVANIDLNGGGGSDTFNVFGLDSIAIDINGGTATDTINFDGKNLSINQSSSSLTSAGKQPVDHTNVETINVSNVPSGGGSNENTNSGGSTNGNTNSGGGNTNSGGSTGGNTNSGGGGTVTNDNGDDGGDPNDANNGDIVDAVSGCAACGAGFVPMMPLMIAGMIGARALLRRSYRRT